MYKLFLKIATRYLLKNKLYSFINIFGLAIGAASFVLIMLYVNYESSYDEFEGSEHVHRVYMDYLEGGKYVPGDANAYIVSGPTLKEKFPEIEDFVRLRRMTGLVLQHDNAIFDDNSGALADPSYFDIFNRTLKKGDLNTALNEPYSIVLSASLADKIFGAQNPIGQTLKIAVDQNSTFTVTGVLKGDVENTHIKNDFLVSFQTFYTWPIFENDWKFTWNQNEYFTYLKVDKNADIELLNQKVMDLKPEGLGNERHHLEPIEDIHLNSNKPYEAEANGSADSVRLLTIIAFITIMLSWMNYMNLSTSKSLERAKEIGVRKVVGARRPQLIMQSLLESALLNFIAIALAIAAVYLLLPLFNRFVGQDFQLDGAQLGDLLPYFGFILLGGLLSAFYPALVLSKYKAVKVLKGRLKTSSNSLCLRRGLIIGQFLVTITLLTGAFIANKQIRFLENRPIGANLDHLVALNGQILSHDDSLLESDFATLLTELEKNPYVKDVALAQTYPGADFSDLNSNIGITFPNGKVDTTRVWYNYTAEPNYFKVMGMEFAAGEAFRQTSAEKSNNIVINERMVRLMGVSDMESLIGQTMNFFDDDFKISGIVKDYHHFGLKSPIEPMIITHNKSIYNDILVKLDESAATMAGTTEALEQLNKTWHQVFPESTYNYTFLDQNFEAQYKEDKKFSSAFQIFTILAILIASMGLFGLTSYTILQRKKEIGIRKVNGASIIQILQLLNQDFVKWVGLAFIIAVPISWYAMSKWLEGFAYRTTMSWWIFALAGIIALFIALLTVSWQSFRAATNNPVDALRDE